MPLGVGARLGPYQVISPIGAGGMGEVYKATDTRLNRIVALKVLPTHFADDPEMKQRFEREAQTIAGLNHPNICMLHDVGQDAGCSYLVMEFVEGETLGDRLARGPLSIDDALRVAGELADALDKAHRQGVIHRDLKPANIMLTRSGTTRQGSSQAKILDFGLAKFTASAEGGSIAAQATRMDVTARGTILGTLQYMAPEQVEGKEADARTDIFAFGAVLYEMLTGKKAFEGKSQASLIGAIMKADPRPISHTQPLSPPVLERLVGRCLAKDPDDRWQDAHSLSAALAWIAKSRGGSQAVAEAPRWRRTDLAIVAAGLVLVAGAMVPAYFTLRGTADPEPMQYRHTTVGLSEDEIALSPNGQTIVFAARPDSGGGTSLFTRPARGVTSVKLAGTADASQPFWSPDSRSIAFVSNGKLKRVDAAGGAAKDLCPADDFSGGTWTAADGGTIVFGSSKGLQRVSDQGGPPTTVSTLASGETGHFWPNVLPDGRHVLYLAWSEDAANRGIYLGAFDSKDRTKIIPAESNARYAASGTRHAASGYIFFQRHGTLFALPFDAAKLAPTGDAAHAADGVRVGVAGRGVFDVSQNGVLLYFQTATAGAAGRGGLVSASFGWIGRGGPQDVAIETGMYGDMDLSPNGKLVAITQGESTSSSSDIWVVDVEKNTSVRLTTDPGDDVNPIWAPDGIRVAFTTWRKGNADIYVKNANNVGPEVPLLETPENEEVKDWSHDGRWIAFMCGRDAYADICALPIDANGKAGKSFPVVQGHFHKGEPKFSFDGKWLAYVDDHNESGKFQVYLISFPGLDVKQQISSEGGGQPRWTQDGKAIYFRLDNQLMAADLKLGQQIEATTPHVLVAATFPGTGASDPTRHQWSITPDGQRMLVRIPTGRTRTSANTSQSGPVVLPQVTAPGTGARASLPGQVSAGMTVVLQWPATLTRVQ